MKWPVLLALLPVALLITSAASSGQSAPAKDFKPLFEAVQALGTDSELRGDISDRLGFGEDPLVIKDLVVTANGVQHALNAFFVSNTRYLLFDSHLFVPEVYIFVRSMDGEVVAGIHGHQGTSIDATDNMSSRDMAQVVGAEEAFWFKWLADRAAAAPTK